MNRLVAIIGPTGVGKSKLALNLAQIFDGEIVSADSRQVYCHMDIGTAKPTTEEQSLVPHRLISIINPDEDFSLAQYQEMAYRAIDDIHQRHKLPLLVGGSGLYVRSVLEGWGIAKVPPDVEFRHLLEERAASGGQDEVYQELVNVDPVSAQNIDQRNIRRVIRALEVYRGSGIPPSQIQGKKPPAFDILMIGLTADRKELYRRIDLRVDEMIKQGLPAEVEKLLDMGYDLSLPAMSGIGYKQIGLFLKGGISLPTAIQQIKYETHRLARHQYAWFQLQDEKIKWFDIQQRPDPEISVLIAEFVNGRLS